MIILCLQCIKAPCFYTSFSLISVISVGSCMYELNLFSPINLSYVNLIIRSAKEPRKETFSYPTHLFYTCFQWYLLDSERMSMLSTGP